MDEAVLHVVELVDIVNNGHEIVLDKNLNKHVNAEGNTSVPLMTHCCEALDL